MTSSIAIRSSLGSQTIFWTESFTILETSLLMVNLDVSIGDETSTKYLSTIFDVAKDSDLDLETSLPITFCALFSHSQLWYFPSCWQIE